MNEEVQRNELLRLQHLLLPTALPDIGCTEVAAAYRAANHDLRLGGDWFDLIDRPESQTVVAVVGDVVGHGVEQIAVMGQLRAASNALAHWIDDPGDILTGLARFAVAIPGARYATVAVVVFDGTDTVHISCAGHPPPIRIDRAGTVHLIEEGRRPVLTIGELAPSGTFQLELGELLVIYTDGVVERRGRDIDHGIRALGKFVSEHFDEPCKNIARDIVDVFGSDSDDDQAVLVARPLNDRGESHRLTGSFPSAVLRNDHTSNEILRTP